MNTRERVLKEALNCVNGEREKQYGNPEDNFKRIATLWTDYINMSFKGFFEAHKLGGIILEPIDVAKMMILFKIARSNGDKDKLDNYVDMIGYASCAAEIFENGNKEENKERNANIAKIFGIPIEKLDESEDLYQYFMKKNFGKEAQQWAESMKVFSGNGYGKEACETINELKNVGKKFAEKIFRPGLTPNNDLNNIELADECKNCDYAKKCMGTGICLKETEKKWFDGCGDKKDKPDDKCNREDCGQFDACMTAYQHYIYNKTKEVSETIDKCMRDQGNKNETKSNSFWDTYKSILAHIVSSSEKEGVDQFDVVSRLTRNGHAPTEMAVLLLVGRINSVTVDSYIEKAINELKNKMGCQK